MPIPIRELIRRGIVEPEEVVRGDILMRPLEGRNRNLALERAPEPAYLLKRPAAAPGPNRLADEAAAYRLLGRSGERVRALAPRMIEALSDDDMLVLELLPEATSLAKRYARDPPVGEDVGADAGAALGLLRSVPVDDRLRVVPRPPALRLPDPDYDFYCSLSSANVEILRIVQDDGEMAELLVAVGAEWEPRCLVHGDVRLANIMLWTDAAGASRLSLVDWEFAGLGDPAWDIGCLLAEYASLWLCSIPAVRGVGEPALAGLAKTPLESLHPTIRAAWNGYRRAEDDQPHGPEPLIRCVRFAGAALAQIALSLGQDANRPRANALLHLQVAANVMRDPAAAAVQMLGLGTARGAAT